MDFKAFNVGIIAEFRANHGEVAQLGDNPILLLHHVGRRSGEEYVAPLAYAPDPTDDATVYVVASAAGGPKDPQWFGNIVAAGEATIELADGSTHPVRVEPLNGEARERAYAAMVELAPEFAEYERKTDGIRVIPVVALHRTG